MTNLLQNGYSIWSALKNAWTTITKLIPKPTTYIGHVQNQWVSLILTIIVFSDFTKNIFKLKLLQNSTKRIQDIKGIDYSTVVIK